MAVGQPQFPSAIDTPDTLIRVANASQTTLSSNINPSAATLNVGSTASFPDSGTLVIEDEVLYYSGKTLTTFTGVTRGQEGTTANSHSAGTEVKGEVLASHHNGLVTAVISTQTQIGAGSQTIPQKFSALDARLTALESAPAAQLPGTKLYSDFSASGSKAIFSGSISLAAPSTLTLTADGDFQPGQGIYLVGAGPTADLITKVTAVAANTRTITLQTPASRATTNQLVQHDETAAFQAMLDECYASKGLTVLFPTPGFFRVNGPVKPATNSILAPPYIPNQGGTPVALNFIAYSQPWFSYEGPISDQGTVIQSDMAGPNDDSSILSFALFDSGSAASIQEFSNYSFTCENITFRTKDNPSLSALDLGLCCNCVLRNVLIDVGMPLLTSAEPTHASFGLRLPRASAGIASMIIDNVYVLGYGVGCYFSEMHRFDYLSVMRCKRGAVGMFGYHHNTGKMLLWHCPTMLEFTDRNCVDLQVDFERAAPGTWDAPISGHDIYDPLDRATGWIKWISIQAGTGINQMIGITGATKVALINLGGLGASFPAETSFAALEVRTESELRGTTSISDGSVMRTISFGADDSAAAGFRNLRIPNSGASSLFSGLVSHWTLDEASGARSDSEGSNHLSDHNAVTSSTGIVGSAALFNGTNQYLDCTSNATLATGGKSFTIAFDVYLNSKATDQNFIGKCGGATDEYGCGYDLTADRLRFFAVDRDTPPSPAADYVIALASSVGSPVIATWYRCLAWVDLVARTVNLRVNKGAVSSSPITRTGTISGTEAFRLGGYSSTVNLLAGRVDEVYFWDRVLTGAEQDEWFDLQV